MDIPLKVYILPVLEDNYIYIVSDTATSECVVIDPGVAEPVILFLSRHNLKLKEIWITHHHSDHIGGLAELKEKYGCRVLGPAKQEEVIPQIDQQVTDMDLLSFNDHPFKVFELPGHTLDHVSYWLYKDKYLFCGDTLFSLGCGFIFEGDYKQMWNSLCKIRALPEDTLIYCGHEYTQKNAKFALSIDPENENLIQYSKEVDEKREKGEPTLPALLKTEMFTNPFLRADLPFWEKELKMPEAPAAEIFKNLRDKKNKFKA